MLGFLVDGREVARDLAHVQPVLGVGLQARRRDLAERSDLRQVRRPRPEAELRLDDASEHRLGVVEHRLEPFHEAAAALSPRGVDGREAGEDFEEQHAEGVHVRLGRDGAAPADLGGDVPKGPAHLRERRLVRLPAGEVRRQPKVAEAGGAAGEEEDVARRHVAVGHGGRPLLVEVGEPRGDVERGAGPLRPREHGARAAVQTVPQRAPRELKHAHAVSGASRGGRERMGRGEVGDLRK
mmetsp:Transcript_11538/g.27391  ORF Transcript_11538/g.27391 Transcript_11538/m.27391 type:complete len:239 (+) Transcript_11538:1336-2052(+)